MSPVTVLVKNLGEALKETGYNKKLDGTKRNMLDYKSVDIGCAMEVEKQLRVAVVRDVTNKSYQQIQEDIKYLEKGRSLRLSFQLSSKMKEKHRRKN